MSQLARMESLVMGRTSVEGECIRGTVSKFDCSRRMVLQENELMGPEALFSSTGPTTFQLPNRTFVLLGQKLLSWRGAR